MIIVWGAGLGGVRLERTTIIAGHRAISALRFTYVKIPKVQIAKILKVPLRNCRICTKQIRSQGNFRWRKAKILTITENHRDLNTEIVL